MIGKREKMWLPLSNPENKEAFVVERSETEKVRSLVMAGPRGFEPRTPGFSRFPEKRLEGLCLGRSN